MLRVRALRPGFIADLATKYSNHVSIIFPDQLDPQQFFAEFIAQKQAEQQNNQEDKSHDSSSQQNFQIVDQDELQSRLAEARESFLNSIQILQLTVFYCRFCNQQVTPPQLTDHCRSLAHINAKDEIEHLPAQGCPVFIHGRPMLFDHHVIFPETIFGTFFEPDQEENKTEDVDDDDEANNLESDDNDNDGQNSVVSKIDSDVPFMIAFQNNRAKNEKKMMKKKQEADDGAQSQKPAPPVIMLFDDTIGALVLPDASGGVQLCPGHEYSLVDMKLAVEKRVRQAVPKSTNTLPSDTDQNRYFTRLFAQVHNKAKGPQDTILKKKKRDAASAYLNLVDGADFPSSINVAAAKKFLDARSESKIVAKRLKRKSNRALRGSARKDADLGLLMTPRNNSSESGSCVSRVAGLQPLVSVSQQNTIILRRRKKVRDRVVHRLAKVAVARQKQELYRQRMGRVARRLEDKKNRTRGKKKKSKSEC